MEDLGRTSDVDFLLKYDGGCIISYGHIVVPDTNVLYFITFKHLYEYVLASLHATRRRVVCVQNMTRLDGTG